jgi:lysophospholipase L1-like esterase
VKRWFVLVTLAPVLLTPSAAAPPPNYVALGDSFTSGPGIPLVERPFACLRSTHNYPHLAAPAGLILRDASCAGAKTVDLTHAQEVVGGSNPPQFDRLDRATRVVTLQMGGNDIGFSTALETCLALAEAHISCQTRYVLFGHDSMATRIAAERSRLVVAIAAIRRRAPHARVFVVGYPNIVPDSDAADAVAACADALPVLPVDIPWLRARTKQLDAVLAAAAAGGGASFIDLYDPSVGRDPCSPAATRWVEPLVVATLAAPVHPNATGMVAFSEVVHAAIAN